MEDQKNILKKGLEKPSVDFTKNLMQKVEAEENSLRRVLKEHAVMKTSSNFSSDLISQLEVLTPKKPYEPVISKHIWIGITAFIAVFIAIVLTTAGSAPGSNQLMLNIKRIDLSFVDTFNSNPILNYTICGVLLLSIALLTEQRMKQRKEK